MKIGTKEHRRKPGTYTERKTHPKGKSKKEPHCRDIIQEVKQKFLKPGETSVNYMLVVKFIMKRLGRDIEKAKYYVDNFPGIVEGIRIEGEGADKKIIF